MASNLEQAQEDTRKFDAKHNDPEAKVILVSSDNVSFRVHAWYVKQKSDFIKDLLDVPSSQSIENAPIQLNQTAEHVHLLVELIYSPGNNHVFTAKQCHAILEMCDHLQMPNVKSTIWRLVYARLNDMDAVGMCPWGAFNLGAIRDMPVLCHDAILGLTKHGVTVDKLQRRPSSIFKDAPGHYVATMLNDNFFYIGHNYRQRDMQDIAERFMQMKEEAC